MSGLDGGAPAPTAGTGGEDISVKGAPTQPPVRTHQQASDELDARVGAKIAAAEGRATPPRPTPNKGPDGRFLPAGVSNIHAPAPKPKASEPDPKVSVGAGAVSPDQTSPTAPQGQTSDTSPKAGAPDPEIEKIKGEHAHYKAEHERLTKRDADWSATAEKALARIEGLKDRLKTYEAMLAQAGVSIDPRDLEIARYREAERVQQLVAERMQAEQQARAQQQQEAQRQQQRDQLITSTRAAMAKFPQVAAGTPEWAEACKLIYRGADPETAFGLMAQKVGARTPAPQTNVLPLLPRGQTGTGGPRLKDPRDIADKWKAQLGAAAR